MLHTLGTVKGGGKNKMLSIARCGTFQGVKKKKKIQFGIILNKIKTTSNPQKMLKPCNDVPFPPCIQKVSTFQIALFHSPLLSMHFH